MLKQCCVEPGGGRCTGGIAATLIPFHHHHGGHQPWRCSRRPRKPSPPNISFCLFLHHLLPIQYGLLSCLVFFVTFLLPCFFSLAPPSHLSCSYLNLEVKTHCGWYTSFIALHTCLGLLLGWENKVASRNNYCIQESWMLALTPSNTADFTNHSAFLP